MGVKELKLVDGNLSRDRSMFSVVNKIKVKLRFKIYVC